MSELPLVLALTAGMLAAVNPCGFALLPAYLSLLVIGEDSPGRATAVRRALVATVALTIGFAAVFLVFGLAVAPAAGQIQEHLPWFTIGFGLLLTVAGCWLVTGRQLPALFPRLRRGAALTRSVPSMALFGASYAIASLGCTIAPFLALVVATFRTDSTVAGIAVFAAYAGGMGLIVGTAALAVALARRTLVTRIRRIGAAASRLGGALLLLAGSYVAYYGWYEIRVNRGAATTDPVIDTAGTAQRWIADTVTHLGPTRLALILTALLITTFLIYRAKHHSSSRPRNSDRTPR